MNKGKIVQVMGPVVDVEFENQDLPYIKDALTVEVNGKKLVMEAAQHIGNNTVRCIMLASSDGLCKDMEVTATRVGFFNMDHRHILDLVVASHREGL